MTNRGWIKIVLVITGRSVVRYGQSKKQTRNQTPHDLQNPQPFQQMNTHSQPPAAGQAAYTPKPHFLPVYWTRVARPKGSTGLDAGYRVMLQSDSHIIGEVMGLEGVLLTDDKSNPTREEIAEGIQRACNSYAVFVRLLEKVERANAIQHSGGTVEPEDWAEFYQLTNEARAKL